MVEASTAELNGVRPEVLVVEDHPTTRKLMSAWLEMSGYTVRQAQDGHEAWKSAQQECPPIVVTDWNMPSMSGLELCRYIRGRYGTDAVYVLIATSRDGNEDLSKAMEAGANDFLSKPVKEDEFLARIKNAENSLSLLRRKTKLADSDALTGLMNRRSFFKYGQRLVDMSLTNSQPLACLALDIDLFKKFNDEYGHSVGDQVLSTVADVLLEVGRDSDLVARLGGDEFCMLLPNTAEEGGLILANRIRERVMDCSVNSDGDLLPIRVTLGVAPLTPATGSVEDLVELADSILRAAKNEGRDRAMSHNDLSRRRTRSGGEMPYARLLENTKASSVMEEVTETIRESASIDDARGALLSSGVDCLSVVSEAGELIGVVTERDLLNVLTGGVASDIAVERIVSSNIARFLPDTPMVRIWESLQRTPMLRIIIVNEEKRPVGLVRRRSLLKMLHDARQ